jgi:tryptophanyl-tRNA synthetase
LKPVREKANELLKDETHLKNLLKIGAEKAEAVASKTLNDAYEALGMISRG